eukprot:Blabericola_migrator_1__11607@NODE_697_length_6827_cov_16_681361_g506_i0_p3_GENE_NODE_697_length_6827_cov_16_681361_g506_i0NODE_697_length_6827_cov_16_681361_g506_i0_p3_ORF_typecomplete_len240_score31_51DUF3563/PF12086_8/0_3_NODE_697_length_6827_cov_16_681361_g506_i09041623
MTLVQSLSSVSKASWFKSQRLHPLDSRAEATRALVRHFVHMVTLKWLSGKMVGGQFPTRAQQCLENTLSEHVFTWMPKWLTLMYGRQALFPFGVSVKAGLFKGMCLDMTRQRHFNSSTDIAQLSRRQVPLDHEDVSACLRHLLKAVGSGTASSQDLEPLMEPHVCPVLSRPNRNMFLTFLLWAWHHKCLPVDADVIANCIKHILYEGALPGNQGRMSANSMRWCLHQLLSGYSVTSGIW